MIVFNENRVDLFEEFRNILERTNERLNECAKYRSEYFIKRNAQLLEEDVADSLKEQSLGTSFENTIEIISGQRFPDIVARQCYGVEVKSSKDDKWITLGGSVNESTRVKGIEKIFLIFGKLTDPVEFRMRSYEECLSEVVVTHFPRYKIDMNLENGQTIFDKMGTTYDEIRQPPNETVYKIVNFYKKKLREGESLWWTGSHVNPEEDTSAPMTVRLSGKLSKEERAGFIEKGFAFFPSIFSSKSTKYERFFLWLATNHGVLATRDFFTAGGRGIVQGKAGHEFFDVPQKLIQLHDHWLTVAALIVEANADFLCETWGVEKIEPDRIRQWKGMVSENFSREYEQVGLFLDDLIFG
ncbi:hypothetical protein [Bombella apis]|uniref:hypothetical protein n=1 Tax=Bombella apis TaxID=1785988 RepID=UPI0024A87512|nr:hypothetical protein [Bombella apis]